MENQKISKSASLDSNVRLIGNVVIEDNVKIFGDCQIENSVIRAGATIKSSYIIDSTVGEGTTVGPYAHIKMNSVIGKNCRIGNFVEIKNSNFGDFSKCAHLTYVGDADIGENVNLGCGVVFANYDGKEKHRSKVGNNVFVGCNCNIIAPCEIEDGCFIAAGTTITKNLPTNSFCVGRVKQEVKPKRN